MKNAKLKKKSMISGKKEAFHDYKNICLWKTQNKIFFIGVTGGYKGLQGLTGGYNEVTKDFRNLAERSQILFLGLFCIKIKVEEI